MANEDEVTTLSAKQAAQQLGTDARTLRKFMRAITPKENQPGQGNRYAIEEDLIPELQVKFTDWAKGKKASPNGQEAAVDEEIEDEELIDEDMLVDDSEPTDDEIEDMEDEEEFDLEEL